MWKNGVGSASLGDEDEGCGWGANTEALLTIHIPSTLEITTFLMGVLISSACHGLGRVSAAAALRVFPEYSLCR